MSTRQAERSEFGYGDLAYKGCDDLITNSEPLNQNAPLTDCEGAYNKRMNKVRARVEHAVAEHVEGKQISQGKYRGSPKVLRASHLIFDVRPCQQAHKEAHWPQAPAFQVWPT
jgi:hypothetical protein